MLRACPIAILLAASLALGCDHGLEPITAPPVGTIRGHVVYTDPAAWPPPDSVFDVRFFALPFIPQDSLDLFRDLNQLVFSGPLRRGRGVAADSFVIENVEAQIYVYSGVAQQFSPDLFDWRPIGLIGQPFFAVVPGEVTEIEIRVDFRNRPPFPPVAPEVYP